MASDPTKMLEVEPGNKTGVYYITISNLPFNTQWKDLKDFVRTVCDVDYAEVFNASTHAWVRIIGYDEFRKAFALLNGGLFNGRCLVADGRNEKEKISIRTLIDVGRAKRQPTQSGQSLGSFPSPVSSSFPSPVDFRSDVSIHNWSPGSQGTMSVDGGVRLDYFTANGSTPLDESMDRLRMEGADSYYGTDGYGTGAYSRAGYPSSSEGGGYSQGTQSDMYGRGFVSSHHLYDAKYRSGPEGHAWDYQGSGYGYPEATSPKPSKSHTNRKPKGQESSGASGSSKAKPKGKDKGKAKVENSRGSREHGSNKKVKDRMAATSSKSLLPPIPVIVDGSSNKRTADEKESKKKEERKKKK